MKPLILVVDDNIDILMNLKMTLEFNEYEVITAENGKKGLEVLSIAEKYPEVIISDIMMPEMDGYDFFKTVSGNPLWNSIPFIFLSAKDSPKDIRLGKMLGADDYITKPFKDDDLLAIIAGKIARNKRIESVNTKMQELIATYATDFTPSVSIEEKRDIILLNVAWDDMLGPDINSIYPDNVDFPFSYNEIGNQLYTAVTSIYGHERITKAEGVFINLENYKMKGYAYFDAFPDNSFRSGEYQYMLAVIAPQINYFQSLKLKRIFNDLSSKIKSKAEWDIKEYWESITEVLLTSSI